MKNKKLLADADFFIALYKKGDSNHERAKKLLRKIKSEGRELIISIFSYSEVVTVLSQNTTHQNAMDFMEDINKSNVKVLRGNKKIFKKAKPLFKKQSSKNVSFVDVLNIIICRYYDMPEILSFDDDYKRNDLRRYGID